MRPATNSPDRPTVPPSQHEADMASVRAELAAAQEKIDNLETALVTARKIGTAVGVVMATYKVTDQAAFDILVMVSQNRHHKLRDVAEDVVATGTLNWGAL